MWIAYFVLLLLYAGLTSLYVLSQAKPAPIPPWPLLTAVPEPPTQALGCTDDSDCGPSEVCLGNTCVRKLLRGGQCNPIYGTWISYHINHVPFAVCSCDSPQYFSQKLFGGDCNVSVACGVHGEFNPATRQCECDPGYRPDGLECLKLPALEHAKQLPCAADEFEVQGTDLAQEGFHAVYIARLATSRCVKRPCSFDALTGRPLKHARFEPGWGCVCDPRRGLFGVRLEGHNKKYLATEGFDACASIFVHDPDWPVSVQYATYFYLGDRPPVSVILFDQLRDKFLVPLLKGKGGRFMITQSAWPHDYAQWFFARNPTFRARTRQLDEYSYAYYPHKEVVRDHVLENDFRPGLCKSAYHSLLHGKGGLSKKQAYQLLYSHPVCRVEAGDPKAQRLFWGKVVVNPHHLTYQDYGDLPRFNALVLSYEANVHQRWTLDLGYEYNIDAYRGFATNAPDWSKP